MLIASQIDGTISCLKEYKKLGNHKEDVDVYIDVLEEEKYYTLSNDNNE